MSAQIRLADLPLATTTDSFDLLLVQDMRYNVSKKIKFSDLNNQLSLEDLSDYNFLAADLQAINDQIEIIIGEGTLVHSLSDIDELLLEVQDSIRGAEASLKGLIETLRENVDTDILNRNQLEQALIEKVETNEGTMIQAGLATGFLYVKEFKGG